MNDYANLEGIIPAGQYTTDDVLGVMSSYVIQDYTDPKIRQLTESITSGIAPNDLRSKMIAIKNWILINMRFTKDANEAKRLYGINEPDLELVKSPMSVLESKIYDCDCISGLIAAMLLSIGIEARFMAVAFHPESVTGPDGYAHVFTQGFDGYDWFVIDPVAHPNEEQMIKDIQQSKVHNISS